MCRIISFTRRQYDLPPTERAESISETAGNDRKRSETIGSDRNRDIRVARCPDEQIDESEDQDGGDGFTYLFVGGQIVTAPARLHYERYSAKNRNASIVNNQ